MNEKISLLLLMVCLSSTLLAQDSNYTSAYPKREFKHNGKIVSEYKIEDGAGTTFVSLEPVFIERSESANTSLRLAGDFQYEGKTPIKPKHISLAIYTLYPECKIPFTPNLTIFVDGEPIKFEYSFKSWRERKPDEEGVAFSFSEMEGERCNEVLAMFISQKNFLKLVNAQNVEIQIAEFKFKLTDSNLEALRDLASRMPM
jgi:hypothetical protein